MTDERTIELEGWDGPWADDDPDANFKSDVALYSHVDPLTTIRNLAAPSTSRSAPSATTCSRSGPRRAVVDCWSSVRR